MAKMNAEIAKRVKALGINAKTEDDAREKLLEILNGNGIEGMEEEDTDTLIEIAESFVEEGGSSDTDDTDSTDESETSDEDALADEVEAEDAEEGDVDEAEDADEDALASMDRTALKAYIKDNGLDIKVKKSWSDDDIREQIRNAECPVAEAEEENEEEPTPAPAPKKAEKKEKKATEKKVSKRGQKLDPKNNEEDRQAFEALHELFPEEEYSYAWVASAGVTIKHKGKNSQRAMVLIENCSKQADESIKCNLYLLTFSKQTDVLDEAGIEYEICWSGAPFMKGITMDSAVEIIKTLMPNIIATVQKIDKRLGENRAKMEESLSKKAAPAAKKSASKKTVKK
jgi:hypothetical protein